MGEYRRRETLWRLTRRESIVLAKMQKLSRTDQHEFTKRPRRTHTDAVKKISTQNLPRSQQPIPRPKRPNILLMIQLLLGRQPIRRKNKQSHGIPRTKATSDVVHRLEELKFRDHLGVGAFRSGGLG